VKVYLMARYGRRQEMLQVAADLEALGHEVTSRWIRGDHELDDNLLNTDPEFRDREGARFAMADLFDLRMALSDYHGCAIAFTEEPGVKHGRGRGGRHFEAGVAYWSSNMRRSYGMPIPRLILVGHKENVFYCLPEWEHYPDWPTCLEALRKGAAGEEQKRIEEGLSRDVYAALGVYA
jgi:hypothetical protein